MNLGVAWYNSNVKMRKFRNEWKYVCPEDKLRVLEMRLGAVLEVDRHSSEDGKYLVRSLYFDDYHDDCARRTEAGVSERMKWRIRYYEGGPTKYIHLELKEKRDGRGHKTTCPITENECRKLMRGDALGVIWETDEELLKRFCAEMMIRGYTPKAIIEYERVAFVEEIAHVRITLDMNIGVSYQVENFLNGKYLTFPVQESKRHVLEVKFDDILPSYIKHVIAQSELARTSFSKYYLGRKRIEEVIR